MRLALCTAFLCALWSGIANAAEVKMGVPEFSDGFVRTLLESKDLKAAGISLVETRLRSEADILDATVNGTLDVSFVPLTAFDRRSIDSLQRIYSVFTRPFLFKSRDEIFATEDTALGDAALADLRRAGLFPLKFWNRGFSKIVARTPISSPSDFERLKVVVESKETAVAGSTLISLGAEPTPLLHGYSIAMAMNKGLAEATVVDPWYRYDDSYWKDLATFSGKLFSTDFEPIIGVFAASNAYWNGLSEREKQAWKRAVDEASLASYNEILGNETIAKDSSKIRPIPLMEKDRYRLIVNYSAAVPGVTNDLKVLEETRTKIEMSEAQKKKK
jgi:TRAP-type C4-dicarboxylate transport system substrate-binding protein